MVGYQHCFGQLVVIFFGFADCNVASEQFLKEIDSLNINTGKVSINFHLK